MEAAESIAIRRRMLGEWVCDWFVRHERVLAQERALIPIRGGPRTLLVTVGEAEDAVARTHDELFRSFASRADWGVDEHGRPSVAAVRGLAARRLADRLRDALRARRGRLLEVGLDADSGDATDTRLSVSPMEGTDTLLVLKQAMKEESPTTREIVLRSAIGHSAVETAQALGLESAAVRQRLSRFRARAGETLAA